MAVVVTVHHPYALEQLFRDHGRVGAYTPHGYAALLHLLWERAEDTGENVEADPVALMGDYRAMSYADLIQDFGPALLGIAVNESPEKFIETLVERMREYGAVMQKVELEDTYILELGSITNETQEDRMNKDTQKYRTKGSIEWEIWRTEEAVGVEAYPMGGNEPSYSMLSDEDGIYLIDDLDDPLREELFADVLEKEGIHLDQYVESRRIRQPGEEKL